MHRGDGLTLLGTKIAATIARARTLGGDTARYADELDAVWKRIVDVTTTLRSVNDTAASLANSSLYLEAFGHTVIT